MKTNHFVVLLALILSLSATLASAAPVPAADGEEGGFSGSLQQLEARRAALFRSSSTRPLRSDSFSTRPSTPGTPGTPGPSLMRSNSMPARVGTPERTPGAPARSNSLPAGVGSGPPVPVHPSNMPSNKGSNGRLVQGLAGGTLLGGLGVWAYEKQQNDAEKQQATTATYPYGP